MEEIGLTSRYGESTIAYRVLFISGGAGFLPSTVFGDQNPGICYRDYATQLYRDYNI